MLLTKINIKTYHELNFAPAVHGCIKHVMHAPNKFTHDNFKYIQMYPALLVEISCSA